MATATKTTSKSKTAGIKNLLNKKVKVKGRFDKEFCPCTLLSYDPPFMELIVEDTPQSVWCHTDSIEMIREVNESESE